MNFSDGSLDAKLHNAAELLNAGQTREARQILREALALDRKNLATWELLWKAAYNVEEELKCLKNILAIDPKHKAAKQRYASIRPVNMDKGNQPPETSKGKTTSRRASKRSSSRKKNNQSIVLLLFLGSLISILCASAAGFALYRGGYIPLGAPSGLTATALAKNNESCQILIDKAIQASGNYCDNTDSNSVCYGNTTIKAELASNANQRFSERGDKVNVDKLRRLSAAPLNLETDEWGIAVFKIIANLPRSLPGETVTMVVFGNATLDNTNGSGNLESFYFSSELGQIACEKVPFDGLMITSPDGSGVRFTINETELTLMGSASIQAVRDGEMAFNIYEGSARVVANGEEQYVGAGQSVSVELGGENGTQATSGPSEPKSLSQEEMDMACTLTGQYCSESQITTVSEEQAQGQIESQITATASIVPTRTLSPTPTSTIPVTNTLLVLPTSTHSPGPPTKTKVPTRTQTPGPTNTPKPTLTFTVTNTPSITPTFTATNPPTSTFTPAPPSATLCGSAVTLGSITNPTSNELGMDITNNGVSTITVNGFFAYWLKNTTAQKLDSLDLGGSVIWDQSDPEPPSDIPLEGNFKGSGDRTIPASGTKTFLVHFQDPLEINGYEVHIFFDSGCKVVGVK